MKEEWNSLSKERKKSQAEGTMQNHEATEGHGHSPRMASSLIGQKNREGRKEEGSGGEGRGAKSR